MFQRQFPHGFQRRFQQFLKQFTAALLIVIAGIGLAWGQVDVNQADQGALGSVKGVGPAMSRHILEARKQGGAFKSWDDLQDRVAGIGRKSAARLSAAGLTVGGKSMSGAPATAKPGGKSAGKSDAAKSVSARPAAAKIKSAG
ncbi:helix-hairpin-helix domain-containing protein [Oxalobacteraceae bacterium CAVE-383]|nr:helix-hairpin-helix domain-containing protein [Oxalobacteraceae bacterium CAVE-383]